MPPYWLIRNLWVRMGHFQNHSFAALVCLDLFSYHDVFSSPPSTLIYRRGGVSSILTQRVECGITYDLEVATEDPKQGYGLPEWIVFAENLYLKSVWLLLPLKKKPKGCKFLGRKDTMSQYYNASFEDNDLSDVLDKLLLAIP